MKAALIDRYGSNDAVSVADIDIPTLGPGGRRERWSSKLCERSTHIRRAAA